MPEPRVSPVRLALAIVAGVGTLATFLPWVRVPMLGGIAGAQGDGWFTFAGFALILLVVLTPTPMKPIGLSTRVVSALLALICSGMGTLKAMHIAEIRRDSIASDNAFESAMSHGISVGPGLWLVIIAAVLVAILACVMRERR